jgi:hypothetical protein
MFKNVASQKVAVFAWNAGTGAAKTGDAANITDQISKDGGATAATNDVNPTELDATDAPGIYIFDLTQAETNADLVILSAVSATSNIQLRPVVIYTVAVAVTSSDIATAVWEVVIENSKKAKHLLSAIFAFVKGEATGGGTTAITFRNDADSVDRIVMTVDSNGNRSTIAQDYSDIP